MAAARLPPGFRHFRFDDDGTVTSTVHFAPDDVERWPRRPFGRTLRSLFDGEITHAELAAIVADRMSERPSSDSEAPTPST